MKWNEIRFQPYKPNEDISNYESFETAFTEILIKQLIYGIACTMYNQ